MSGESSQRCGSPWLPAQYRAAGRSLTTAPGSVRLAVRGSPRPALFMYAGSSDRSRHRHYALWPAFPTVNFFIDQPWLLPGLELRKARRGHAGVERGTCPFDVTICGPSHRKIGSRKRFQDPCNIVQAIPALRTAAFSIASRDSR